MAWRIRAEKTADEAYRALSECQHDGDEANRRSDAYRVELATMKAPTPSGKGWWCWTSAKTTGCVPEQEACEQSRSELRLEPCKSQVRAACVSHVKRLTGDRFRQCSATFQHCNEDREELQRQTADVAWLSDCVATE